MTPSSFPPVVIVLVAISIVGTTAIPFGDPQFLYSAVALELSFIMIAVLTYKRFHKELYDCIRLWLIRYNMPFMIYFHDLFSVNTVYVYILGKEEEEQAMTKSLVG